MGILVAVGLSFGMILGQFFRCYVLAPACGLAVVVVLANPVHMNDGLLSSFLQVVVLITSLKIGYLVGLIAGSAPVHLSVRGTSAFPIAMPWQGALRPTNAAEAA